MFKILLIGALALSGAIACEQGKTGVQGEQGEQGKTGARGVDGVNGYNGIDGIDGINGTDGRDGANGKDGTNGATGAAGADGRDGVDGRSFVGNPSDIYDMVSEIDAGAAAMAVIDFNPDHLGWSAGLGFGASDNDTHNNQAVGFGLQYGFGSDWNDNGYTGAIAVKSSAQFDGSRNSTIGIGGVIGF